MPGHRLHADRQTGRQTQASIEVPVRSLLARSVQRFALLHKLAVISTASVFDTMHAQAVAGHIFSTLRISHQIFSPYERL